MVSSSVLILAVTVAIAEKKLERPTVASNLYFRVQNLSEVPILERGRDGRDKVFAFHKIVLINYSLPACYLLDQGFQIHAVRLTEIKDATGRPLGNVADRPTASDFEH